MGSIVSVISFGTRGGVINAQPNAAGGGGVSRAFAQAKRDGPRKPDSTFASAALARAHLDAEVTSLSIVYACDPHVVLAVLRKYPLVHRSDPRLFRQHLGCLRDARDVAGINVGTQGTCVICDATHGDDDVLTVGSCGHMCHTECISNMALSYANQGRALPYPCPHLRCPGILERATMDAAGIQHRRSAMDEAHLTSAYAACPTPGCPAFVLPFDSEDLLPGGAVRCGECGADFCHACRAMPHTPIACAKARAVVDALVVPLSDHKIRCVIRAIFGDRLPPRWVVEEQAIGDASSMVVTVTDANADADADADANADVIIRDAQELIASSFDDATSLPELSDLEGAFSRTAAKFCPKCFVSIVRIDGCVSMLCPICKHAFCYDCLGPVHTHGLSCANQIDFANPHVRSAAQRAVWLEWLNNNDDNMPDMFEIMDKMKKVRASYEQSRAMCRLTRAGRMDALRVEVEAFLGTRQASRRVLLRSISSRVAREREMRAWTVLSGTFETKRMELLRTISTASLLPVVETAALRMRLNAEKRFQPTVGFRSDPEHPMQPLLRVTPKPISRPRTMTTPLPGSLIVSFVNKERHVDLCDGSDVVAGTDNALYQLSPEELLRSRKLNTTLLRAWSAMMLADLNPALRQLRPSDPLCVYYRALYRHAHVTGATLGPKNLPRGFALSHEVALLAPYESFLTSVLETEMRAAGIRWADPWTGKSDRIASQSIVDPTCIACLEAIERIDVPSAAALRRRCVMKLLYGNNPPATWMDEEEALFASGYFLIEQATLQSLSAHVGAVAHEDETAAAAHEDVDEDVDEDGASKLIAQFLTLRQGHEAQVAIWHKRRVAREEATNAEAAVSSDTSLRDREACLRAELHTRGFVRKARQARENAFEAKCVDAAVWSHVAAQRERAFARAQEAILGRAPSELERTWLRPVPKPATMDTPVRADALVTLDNDYNDVNNLNNENHPDDSRFGPLRVGVIGRVVGVKYLPNTVRIEVLVDTTKWWYSMAALRVVSSEDINSEISYQALRQGWRAMQAACLQPAWDVPSIASIASLAADVEQLHLVLQGTGYVDAETRPPVSRFDMTVVADYEAYLSARIRKFI